MRWLWWPSPTKSMALDGEGHPHFCYGENVNNVLKYATSAVRIIEPSSEAVWPVGSMRPVRWTGVGPVDLYLSVDGGRTFDLLRRNIIRNLIAFQVPHAPTRFARIRVQRETLFASDVSDGLFAIESSIVLISLKAEAAPDGAGILLTWDTNPGPKDLAGYRLERRQTGEGWMTLPVPAQALRFLDGGGSPGTEYRLTAINGLGGEQFLGEVTYGTLRPLFAAPSPFRGGIMTITFATASGPGGGPAPAAVELFDVRGALIRTLAKGDFTAGVQATHWDGTDSSGRPVSAGLYLLHLVTAGQEFTTKVQVVR